MFRAHRYRDLLFKTQRRIQQVRIELTDVRTQKKKAIKKLMKLDEAALREQNWPNQSSAKADEMRPLIHRLYAREQQLQEQLNKLVPPRRRTIHLRPRSLLAS